MFDDRHAVTLRRTTAGELSDYKTLRDLVLAAHPEAFTSDAETDSRRPAIGYLDRLGTPPLHDGHFTLGAWRDGVLVGAVSCDRDPRRKGHHVGHVVGMMVLSGAQRGGIGSRLLAACIAEARRADGLEMLTLSVTAGNHGATAMYRRAGFVCYGTLPGAIKVAGVYHAKDLMLLHLRGAAQPAR